MAKSPFSKSDDGNSGDNPSPTDNPGGTQTSLSTGLFVRSLALARLALSTSGDLWTMKAGAVINSPDCPPEKREELQEKLEEQAREIARELGTLKGSVMKVGQLLSMYGEHFLPPQVNRVLKSLQASAPALEWETIEPFIKQQFESSASASNQKRFDDLEISPQAIAAASIGQVHKAKVKSSGEMMALKVQYPGVERAIRSDLRALKALMTFAPRMPRGSRIHEIILEIEDMLWREVDYLAEAECSEKFAALLKDDPRFLIPAIKRDWCTPKILAVQLICGHRIDAPTLREVSQERRNAIADSLLELYLRELFEFGCVQTDPHIGNYRVRLKGETDCDGKIVNEDHVVLLDFGAVRTFERGFLENYHALICASLDRDPKGVTEAGLALGFLVPCDPSPVTEAFYEFCRLGVEPFDPEGASEEGLRFHDADGSYSWQNNTLPNRLTAQLRKVIQAREFRAPPREAIFLDRKSSGLYILLSALGARTKVKDKVERLRSVDF